MDVNLVLAVEENNQEIISGYPEADIFKFYAHPQETFDLLKKVNNVPENVPEIILKHHYRPDGSGFPSGNAVTVSPLEAIFILSHAYVHKFYMGGFDRDRVPAIYKEIAETFKSPQFKVALKALTSALATLYPQIILFKK